MAKKACNIVKLAGSMPVRCAIAASAADARVVISVVSACAEFASVNWHCRAKSPAS